MAVIRPYMPADWEGISQAHDLARRIELRYAELEAAFLPLAVAAEREDLFAYQLLVAVEDGRAVGFASFAEQELAWLYVHPDFQHRGLGCSLARAALAAMGPGEKTVEVLAGNSPALALYKSLGFVETEVLTGHMPGNEAFQVTVHCLTLGDGAM